MPAVSRLAEFFKGQAILLEYLACMLCGFILSNAFLLGQLAPFGVAFTAAGKKERTTAAGAGALLGYIFSFHPENNTRYIAAVTLAVAVKWLLPPKLMQKYQRWIAPGHCVQRRFAAGNCVGFHTGVPFVRCGDLPVRIGFSGWNLLFFPACG